jgi:potassium efflux system protein
MRQPNFFGLLLLGLFFLMMQPYAAAEKGSLKDVSHNLVSREILAAKIKKVEAASDQREEVKTKLVELYRKALSNLEEANANDERSEAFQNETKTAPEQTLLIREQIEAAKITDPLDTLGVTLEMPLDQIERQLQKEQADLAAVDARRADFESRLADEKNRVVVIRQRLAEGAQEKEEIAAALRVPPAADEMPLMAEARGWVRQTKNAALSAEINMLNQELLSHSMRLDLLKAKRDQAALKVSRIGTRVKALNELVNRKRQMEAEQTKIAAEETRRETAGLDPVLVRFADRNAEITGELNEMVARADQLQRGQEQADKLAARIAADYSDAKAALQTTGWTMGLGQVLIGQRATLPDVQDYTRKASALEKEIVAAVVRRLQHREEARRIINLDQTVAALETPIAVDKRSELRDRLRHLVEQRQTLLRKALEADDRYLTRLRELDTTERGLLDTVRTYEDFLSEHLLWLRTADPTGLGDLSNLPDEARRLISPGRWSGLGRVFIGQVAHSPSAWLALLLLAALVWKRRTLVAAIKEISGRVGRPTSDRFAYTLRALVLTLLAAAPLPLLLVLPGWQLQVSDAATDLSHAVGISLIRVAVILYFLRVSRMIFIPRGLAAAHFGWPASTVTLLRVNLDRLTWIYLPSLLVTRLAIDVNPVETGGLIARLGLLVISGALALFFYRVFHPNRGVLAQDKMRHEAGVLVRANKLWFPLLCAFPLLPAALALIGYIYSAKTLTEIFVFSLWMIAGLVVIRALVLRWLLVVRRRLAYQAALERQQAVIAARKQAGEPEAKDEESGVLQVEEPEVDLQALSDDTHQLVRMAMIFAALVGLYLIWSPLLPAMRIFDDISLWHHTVTVDGVEKSLPITLADLGLALIILFGMSVLAKRLPAVLEMILLQRFDMSAGSRYTVKTLTNYVIVAVGILLVLSTIGVQWSQLQWLVAALGVGIGFGLQEIVANFISGLIILFERPVRVGDIVTVGDTDGVVTKIRIRATTIRNWDRKELLVPNKEFITGRLLNWSLSDQMIRVAITVGVAYGTDVDRALDLMREAAEEHERVLDDPKPILSFEGFGDNSLTLILRAFLGSIDYRLSTITELHKAINRKLAQAGINIAFPQRDVHMDLAGPLEVRVVSDLPDPEAGKRSSAPRNKPVD